SRTMTATGRPTLTISDTTPPLKPKGSRSRTAVPNRHITSSARTTLRARRRRHRTPIASISVASASSIVTTPSAAMKTSPPSANGRAEMPAISQNSACMSSITKAASGRDEALALINLPHQLLVEVDGKRARGVVDDPDVQHRGRRDVERTDRARSRRSLLRAARPVAVGPRLPPILVGGDRGLRGVVELVRGELLLRRRQLVGGLEHGAGVDVSRVGPGEAVDPHRRHGHYRQRRQRSAEDRPPPPAPRSLAAHGHEDERQREQLDQLGRKP